MTRVSTDDAGRVARVLKEDWLKYRLVPRLFAAAGRLREDERREGVLPFGFTEVVATGLLLDPWNDNLWKELGRNLAIGEVREFLETLATRCPSRPRSGPLVAQVSGILSELQPYPGCAAIFAPPRYALLKELGLPPQPGGSEDPRSLRSPWYRGTFEDAPVFSVPMTPPRPLWVADVRSLGVWRTQGKVDRLDVRIGPAREGTGSAITAEEWFEIEVTDPEAAVAVAIADPEPETV